MRYLYIVVLALMFVACAEKVQSNDDGKNGEIKDIEQPIVEDKELLPPQVPQI